MGLFGKKLTAEQQEELNIATGNLNSLSADCREAYNQFKSSIKELYLICRPTRQMNLVEPAGEENLIQLSKRAADEYLRTVLGAQSRLSAIELPKGIKKKHRK